MHVAGGVGPAPPTGPSPAPLNQKGPKRKRKPPSLMPKKELAPASHLPNFLLASCQALGIPIPSIFPWGRPQTPKVEPAAQPAPAAPPASSWFPTPPPAPPLQTPPPVKLPVKLPAQVPVVPVQAPVQLPVPTPVQPPVSAPIFTPLPVPPLEQPPWGVSSGSSPEDEKPPRLAASSTLSAFFALVFCFPTHVLHLESRPALEGAKRAFQDASSAFIQALQASLENSEVSLLVVT